MGTCTMSQGKDLALKMSPELQKQKRRRREWRKCDEQTRLLWEVWDLETIEGRHGPLGEEIGRNKDNGTKGERDVGFLDCTPLQH